MNLWRELLKSKVKPYSLVSQLTSLITNILVGYLQKNFMKLVLLIETFKDLFFTTHMENYGKTFHSSNNCTNL